MNSPLSSTLRNDERRRRRHSTVETRSGAHRATGRQRGQATIGSLSTVIHIKERGSSSSMWSTLTQSERPPHTPHAPAALAAHNYSHARPPSLHTASGALAAAGGGAAAAFSPENQRKRARARPARENISPIRPCPASVPRDTARHATYVPTTLLTSRRHRRRPPPPPRPPLSPRMRMRSLKNVRRNASPPCGLELPSQFFSSLLCSSPRGPCWSCAPPRPPPPSLPQHVGAQHAPQRAARASRVLQRPPQTRRRAAALAVRSAHRPRVALADFFCTL